MVTHDPTKTTPAEKAKAVAQFQQWANDDGEYMTRRAMAAAGPNHYGRDRLANPHWTSTFNDRRPGR